MEVEVITLECVPPRKAREDWNVGMWISTVLSQEVRENVERDIRVTPLIFATEATLTVPLVLFASSTVTRYRVRVTLKVMPSTFSSATVPRLVEWIPTTLLDLWRIRF
jgi:hypothetical protein